MNYQNGYTTKLNQQDKKVLDKYIKKSSLVENVSQVKTAMVLKPQQS